MSTETKKPASDSRDNLYNPRPEIATSYRELMYGKPYTRVAELIRQSELAKPYGKHDYQAMEHWAPETYPRPWTWGSSDISPPSDDGGTVSDAPDEEYPELVDGDCILGCDTREIEQCDVDFYCTFTDSLALRVQHYVKKTHTGDTIRDNFDVILQNSVNRYEVCNDYFGESGYDQIVFKFDYDNPPGVGTVFLRLLMWVLRCRDPILTIGKAWCTMQFRVTCPYETCDEADPVSIDTDLTPETIEAGDSATIYLSDGVPPFTWEVAGTGYTLDNETTTLRQNNVNSAEGDCDSEYGPVATITITDSCENTATWYLRNTTDGAWCTCYSIATGGYPNPCGPGYGTTIDGEIKYDYCCDGSYGGAQYGYDCGPDLGPDCGRDDISGTMTAASICGGGACNKLKCFNYYVWTCGA